jgi:hypothetical protein
LIGKQTVRDRIGLILRLNARDAAEKNCPEGSAKYGDLPEKTSPIPHLLFLAGAAQQIDTSESS